MKAQKGFAIASTIVCLMALGMGIKEHMNNLNRAEQLRKFR